MIGLYIGSTQGYSGKNLVTLALGQHFQREGHQLGYMKPVGTVPHKIGNEIGDEDAYFMQQALGLSENPSLVSPVVITRDFRMRAFLEDCANLMPGIVDSYKQLSNKKDLMLVGGSGSFLYSGKYCGVDGLSVAQALGTKVILVDRYLQEYNYDYLAAAKEALGDDLVGVILNDVPEHFREEAETLIVPFLKRRGVDVLGIVPHDPVMSATKEVGDAIQQIQHGTRKNIENVDRTVKTIEEATSLAKSSGETLTEIVNFVDLSTDQVRSIATASEEQSSASEEINRSVEEVNRIAAETMDALRQSAQAVAELAQQAQELNAMVQEMQGSSGSVKAGHAALPGGKRLRALT